MKTFPAVPIFLLSLVLTLTTSLSGIAQQPQSSLTETRAKAEGGDASEQYILGARYAYGEGLPKDQVVAVKWFRKAADQGHAKAQFFLGSAYASGEGVPKDAVVAVSWYRKAADQGLAPALYRLGEKYAYGEGVTKDAVVAVQLFRKAADLGDAWAQFSLGLAYGRGEGVSKDQVEAVKWYRKAAEQGHAPAQHNLGARYVYGEGVPKDEAQAYQWLLLASAQGNTSAKEDYTRLEMTLTPAQRTEGQRLAREFKPKLTGGAQALVWNGSPSGIVQQQQPSLAEIRTKAESGQAVAQYFLGRMYASGQVVTKDAVAASMWFRRAADQGHAEAQFFIGRMYKIGAGVTKDAETSAMWFRKAADQGFAEAQFFLGYAYASGEGVTKDQVEAVEWYRKAAEQGFARAQSSLGLAYGTGEGVKKDEVVAVKWYRKAAEQGDAWAQAFLGEVYAGGEGVPKNEVEAYRWLLLAAAQGNTTAKERCILIGNTLTPEKRAEGQRLAREFKPEISITKKEPLKSQTNDFEPYSSAKKAIDLAPENPLPSSQSVGWEVVQVNGRDYVTLESIHQFYRFSSYKVEGTDVLLSSNNLILKAQIGSREILINNIKSFLSYPVIESGGSALFSRLDLCKLIDPVLRPSYITNAEPFDTIVVDAGHGGHDVGASGVSGYEKDFTLKLATFVKDALQEKGFKVVLTRSTDTFITDSGRAVIANATPKSIFLSLHFNSSDNSKDSGIETFALTPHDSTASLERGGFNASGLTANSHDSANIALATAVHAMIISRFKFVDRGIKRTQGSVLSELKRPGLLFEGGFVTNDKECRLIASDTYLQSVSTAIADGMINYRTAMRGAMTN
jgi:TPR repeat protein